jgi:hypothetical protein
MGSLLNLKYENDNQQLMNFPFYYSLGGESGEHAGDLAVMLRNQSAVVSVGLKNNSVLGSPSEYSYYSTHVPQLDHLRNQSLLVPLGKFLSYRLGLLILSLRTPDSHRISDR